jgi:hypothetical protein
VTTAVGSRGQGPHKGNLRDDQEKITNGRRREIIGRAAVFTLDWCAGRRNRSKPLVLGLLTGFASLGLIPEALVMKEYLLTGCPGKVLVAIDTLNRSILVLAFRAGY